MREVWLAFVISIVMIAVLGLTTFSWLQPSDKRVLLDPDYKINFLVD